jgi:hypothetical protein
LLGLTLDNDVFGQAACDAVILLRQSALLEYEGKNTKNYQKNKSQFKTLEPQILNVNDEKYEVIKSYLKTKEIEIQQYFFKTIPSIRQKVR